MRKRLLAFPVFGLAILTTICITFAGPVGLQDDENALAAADTCATKHCQANTHCCIGCTSKPICVRNGVPCPECAPQ